MNNLYEGDEEARFLLNLNHKNIIKMYEYRNFGKVVLSDGTVHPKLYFILEHADLGTVYDLVTNCGVLNENLARLYFSKLVDAVEHIHNLGCVHLDIKPMNIFLKSDEDLVKLGDFGHAYEIKRYPGNCK
jgi:serine/threonine protein kinase